MIFAIWICKTNSLYLDVFTISADQAILIRVANELKMQFKQKRFHSPDDIEEIWQILYPEHFINVLLIHHIRQRKEEDIKEVACIMRDGLAHYDDRSSFQFSEHLFALKDDQFYHKRFKTSKISDIFEPFKNEDGSMINPKLILIDGAPGMGKTTLCKEIAYRWANAELLVDSSIVFMLHLRDPGTQKICDLKDLIHYFYSFEPSCEGLAKQCAEVLAKRDNSDITILMDGYDEFNDKDNDLLIKNIIKRKILSQCRIVITSRPIASEKLQKLADVRVEVLGFNKESKTKYIHEELKNYPMKIRSLLSYLDKHSNINQLCYVPIMMTIMVCSFKQYEELPTNESEVYERFVTLAISHCLERLDDKLPTSILALNKLPVKYQTYIQQLTKFAFKTLEGGRVIFNNEDIERLSPYLALHSKELQGLGLLKATEHFSIKDMSKCVWYNFLHLSVHEFLAAYYLRSLKPSEQFQILKNTFFLKHYINVWDMFIGLQQSNTYNFHQFVTYSYVYGASDEAKYEMTLILQKLDLHHFPVIYSINFKRIDGTYQLFCSKNNEDDSIDVAQQMIATTFDANHLLQLYGWHFTSNITQLFVSLCSVDSNDPLIEMYFIDKRMQYAAYYQAISELEQNQNLSVMLVGRDTLVGYRSNCYQLSNALNMNTSLEYVILKYCLINYEIANALSSYLLNSHHVKHLSIINSKIVSKLVPLKAPLQAKYTIKVLNFKSNDITTEVVEGLASIIKQNTNLEQLYLADNDLTTSSVLILQAIKENSKLKLLDLNGNNMTGKAAKDLVSIIKNNSNLEQLHLANNDLRISSSLILHALKETSKLKVLNLNNNNMTGETAEDLVTVIKNNSNLEQLYLGNNNLRTSSILILQAIKEKSKLKALNLNGNNMTGEVAEDLASVIKNNSNLEQIGLANNDLGTSSILILQALKENSKLQLLDLNGNNITGEAAEDLASVIKNNSNLEQLGLANNDLKTSSILVLQALKENSKVKVLDLNSNNMTGKAAEDLASVIRNNSNLEQLHLANNNLKTSSILILQTLKEICRVTVLDLNGNNMTGEAAENLASVIKSNCNLERLHLANNELRISLILILQALKENSKLQLLDLNDNNMTEQAAEDLASVIKNNSDLEQIGLANNDLKTSSVLILRALKENSKLKALDLNGNNMTGEAAEDLASVIKNNYHLEQLHLANNDLRTSSILILQAIKENSKLKALNLNGNKMTGEVTEDLASVIKNNSDLEQIGLANNDLKTSSVLILRALKENSKLKALDLNGNNMTGEAAEDLASVIKNNYHLEQLHLANNDLRTSSILILQAIKENSKLKALNLNGNKMTGEVTEDLASVIKNNSNLEQLYLANNDLKTSSILILQALKENSKLKALNLNGNNMTGQVAEDLASVIKNNSNLEQLYLANNNLKTSSILILQALKNNSRLQILDFDNNYMTGETAEDLASVIKSNSNLKELYLANNNFKTSSVLILQALKENSKLKALNLNSNNMTGEAAEDLSSIIKCNSNLEWLYLGYNNLKASGGLILRALQENTKLKVLNLNNNDMTGEVAENIAGVIKNNSNLEKLYLSNNNFNTSGVLILQALKSITHLRVLALSNNLLYDSVTELTATELLSNNPLITELFLGGNMLQNRIIDINRSSNSLKNLQVMELSHNSFIPMNIVHLVSLVTNANMLQVLLISGLILNIKERFHVSVFQFYDASKQRFVLQNNSKSSESTTYKLEIFCVEVWRLQFAGRVKLNYELQNYFPTKNITMQAIPIDMNLNFITVLSIAKLGEQKLSQLDATNLIFSLSSIIKALKVLDLGYNNINKEAAVQLATALNCNNVLEQLWLRGNVLGADGAAVILSSLQNITTLRVLDLSYNSINSRSANGIAAVINSNHFLEQLWLDGNMLMTTGVVIIASALKKHSNLTLLSLSNNEITEDAADQISAIVNSNNLLGGLLLSNNQLQFTHLSEITKPYCEIHFLHILELSNNFINAIAADELAVTLSTCVCLKELYLGNNNLGTTGGVKILQAVKNIPILQVLSLNNNNITTEAASEICNAVNTNTNLDILLLGGNDLQTSGVLQIADTVKNNNPTMQLLSLSDNNVDEQVKEDIKVMLCDQCDLELFI